MPNVPTPQIEAVYGERLTVQTAGCHCKARPGHKKNHPEAFMGGEGSYWCRKCNRVFGFCSEEHEPQAIADWAGCCDGRAHKMLKT